MERQLIVQRGNNQYFFKHLIAIFDIDFGLFYRLNLELKTGKHYGADVPLSLSVRFNEDIVVRRMCQNGIWSDEERDENLHSYALNNPLIPGEKFLNF